MNVRSSAAALPCLALAFVTGCATMGRVTNIAETACRNELSQAVSAILISQGEKPETADNLADGAVRHMLALDIGPRPFFVASSSGTDYTFFVQTKKSRCLLRLYGKQKGFWSYTNNLTYIATRRLPQCMCSE